MGNPKVKAYEEGGRHFYRIRFSADPDVGAVGHLYDSQQDHRRGYASEEEATHAGLNQVRRTIFSILDQFIHHWPHGCPAQEWQDPLPKGFPLIVWDAFFEYLLQGDYVREEANVYGITEEGKKLRTQLKEIVEIS